MSKNKDLEEMFLEQLEKKKLRYTGKIYSLGSVAFHAEYTFGNTVVAIIDKNFETKLEAVRKFKKSYSGFNIILLTNDCDRFIGLNYFTEIYDKDSMDKLIKKLKDIYLN
jgi:hypothetical protein